MFENNQTRLKPEALSGLVEFVLSWALCSCCYQTHCFGRERVSSQWSITSWWEAEVKDGVRFNGFGLNHRKTLLPTYPEWYEAQNTVHSEHQKFRPWTWLNVGIECKEKICSRRMKIPAINSMLQKWHTRNGSRVVFCSVTSIRKNCMPSGQEFCYS